MISVEFCSAEAVLLGRRQRRRLVVEFGHVDTLQANCDLPVLDRRLSGSTDDHCLIEHMGWPKRRRAVFAQFDGVGADLNNDFRRVRVGSTCRPELTDINRAIYDKHS
jgi:hypothetical protein